MENIRDKATYIIHFRDIPEWIKKLPVVFHLLAEFARRARRVEGETVWNGEIIHLLPRQFITGRIRVSEILGITEGEYRSAYKKLERFGYIKTINATKRYTISEFRADSLFDVNIPMNSPSELPSETPPLLPSDSPQTTTNKNDNKDKNVNSRLGESEESQSYKEKSFQPLSETIAQGESEGLKKLREKMRRLGLSKNKS